MLRCATSLGSGRWPGRRSPSIDRGERGTALLVILGILLLLGGIVGALMPLVLLEPLAASHGRDARAWRAAAEGALEIACAELASEPTWDAVLSGTAHAVVFETGALDLRAVGAEIEREWGTRLGRGADTPRWALYGAGPASRWLGPAVPGVPDPILAVWVADDGADGDGAPLADSNGRLLVHAEARGPRQGRAAVAVLIERAGPSPQPVRRIAWWSI